MSLPNIQDKETVKGSFTDVSLPDKRVIYCHTKTGKLQSVPLCRQMAKILSEYMGIRGGEPEDYSFCTVHGEMMSENALS